MSDELVTIARFSPGGEAEIARARLDSEGIEAVIEGEDAAAAFPYVADAGMQIELQVRECDAERAIAILKEIPAARDNLAAADES
jgi:hypothetical protein